MGIVHDGLQVCSRQALRLRCNVLDVNRRIESKLGRHSAKDLPSALLQSCFKWSRAPLGDLAARACRTAVTCPDVRVGAKQNQSSPVGCRRQLITSIERCPAHLVAASTYTPSRPCAPSISVKSWLTTRSVTPVESCPLPISLRGEYLTWMQLTSSARSNRIRQRTRYKAWPRLLARRDPAQTSHSHRYICSGSPDLSPK